VPDDYLDEGCLVGPPGRIRERWKAWETSGATGLMIHTQQPEALELMAELAGCEPRP
jgi:alkanesulfonate monooxygenase SsuD/methylene tetrahydromethanopterin reductase-like flavin-dependent oxidoreductase (luciferase family)